MRKTPKFWSTRDPSLYSVLLQPLSLVYRLASWLRRLLNICPYRPKTPLICVGGIAVGGSGKTPVAIEIAKILRDNNKSYCFLTKGYGGKGKGIIKLGMYNSDAYVVGDEALVLFEHGDTFVSKNRVRGLKYIDNHHSYDYIVMDDGLQNPTFLKNKKVLVIDCKSEFKNNFILPAGPLRESFSTVIRRGVDIAILIGEDKDGIADLCARHSVMVTKGVIKPAARGFSGKYIAICGIAHPDKFKKTLVDSGVDIVKFIDFGDHHSYKDGDLESLRKTGYNLITTKKDWVKIRSLNIDKSKIHVLDIFVDFEDRTILERALLEN
ncbi:MAG: tetraacyldisaccharide 4'-kinase [Rickettsiales bacterium]|jgi:tetraacyldisaccharide 4'-kinase|nr:tetraacyldisaccharide 4'-kinase [Rickettsiales bacterium]